jgi:glycosyltransferase involved in cell wall biosynthesis
MTSVNRRPPNQPDEAHGGNDAFALAAVPEQIKISILMCAFNEQQRIVQAINEVLSTIYPCDIELIVVDDGSTDDTALLAEKISDPRLTVYRHETNKGKGSALRTAAAYATGTHMLPFDADLEYSSEDIPRLIEPLIKRRYHVVYGARIFGFNTVYQSYRYAVGNRMFTRLANILFDASISDLHTRPTYAFPDAGSARGWIRFGYRADRSAAAAGRTTIRGSDQLLQPVSRPGQEN